MGMLMIIQDNNIMMITMITMMILIMIMIMIMIINIVRDLS
jgi:hypothetical protein